MKKSFALLLSPVLLLAGLLPGSIAAAETAPDDDPASTNMHALAVEAPGTTVVGQVFTIRVVDAESGIPIGRAGVWSIDMLHAVPEIASAADIANASVATFLGWTNRSGELTHAYRNAGWRVLAGFKSNYMPGFARINVLSQGTLAIKVPDSAFVGQPVRMTVYERHSGSPVGGAGIWAIPASEVPVTTGSSEGDVASLVQKSGNFLGFTGNDGVLVYTFDKPNAYLLVAVKDHYASGLARIKILSRPELAIRNPETVRLFQPAPMRVVEKSVLTLEIPVPKAGVWAVSMTDAASIAAEQDMAALTTKHGIFLGWTTEDGYVSPTPRFIRPGQYWLVAVKDGYVPGISKIMVVPLPVVTPTVLPLPAAPAITNKAPGNTSMKSAATAPVRPVAIKPAVSE